MKILSDAEDIKDIPSLEIVQNLISKVVAKTVPCDNEVITENYKLGTNVQTALSNLLTYTYVNASGISQLSTSLQSAWDIINSISSTSYTGGSGIVVSGSVIGHSNNLSAEGTVNTDEIQSPDFGENATLTWFKYDKQGHVTSTGSGGIKIPVADTTLSSTSTRPISSKAVYDNLIASVIRATTRTVGTGDISVSIYDDVQETLEGFQSHIYKLHTGIMSLGSTVGVLNTYKDSINISAGSTTVPVYFNNGVPTVCQYTLGSICTKSDSDYLPITGGNLTGKLTVNSDIVIPNTKAVADNTVPVAGSLATITNKDFTQLKDYKSLIGTIKDSTDNVWYDVISVRHRNGYNDGSSYGMYIRTSTTSSGGLIWNKQTAASNWQGERTILDSVNYTSYPPPEHTHAISDVTNLSDSLTLINNSLTNKADADHSHNYAASTYAGGPAISANKLNTNAGSGAKPVYFLNGVPTECTYELNKTVPSDAVFTDGCIDQKNNSGNLNLPLLLGFNNDTDVNGFAWKNSKFKANPSTGELIASIFNGQLAWGNVTGKPSSYTPSSHSHSMSDISSLNTTINSLSSTLNSINTALELHKVSKPLTKSSGQSDLIVRAESYVQYNNYLWKFSLYFTNAKNIPANTETVIATTSYPPKYTVVKTGVSIWKNDNSTVHTNNATVKIKSNGDITITTPTAISGTGVNYARMNGEVFIAVNF